MTIFFIKQMDDMCFYQEEMSIFIISSAFQEKNIINFGKNLISSKYPISTDTGPQLL